MKIHFLFIFLFIVACSGQGPNVHKDTLEISFGSINANEYPGGLTIQMTNTVTKEVISKTVTVGDYKISLPNGTWDFVVVGFDGPGIKAGASYCGKKLAQELNGNDLTLKINTTAANCAEAIFASLLPFSQWDVAQWDNPNGKWAP